MGCPIPPPHPYSDPSIPPSPYTYWVNPPIIFYTILYNTYLGVNTEPLCMRGRGGVAVSGGGGGGGAVCCFFANVSLAVILSSCCRYTSLFSRPGGALSLSMTNHSRFLIVLRLHFLQFFFSLQIFLLPLFNGLFIVRGQGFPLSARFSFCHIGAKNV